MKPQDKAGDQFGCCKDNKKKKVRLTHWAYPIPLDRTNYFRNQMSIYYIEMNHRKQ